MNIFCIVVFLYIIILITSPKRYLYLSPTIVVYPNNNKEINEVEEAVLNRTQEDESFFNKTDPSVCYAFLNETYLSYYDLKKILAPSLYIIYFFKYTINRARPEQMNPKLNLLYSRTSNTPSYPSGHAVQAYILAKKLSKIHPEKKELFYRIAKNCDNVRVKAGLHYPSDGKFAEYLVNNFF